MDYEKKYNEALERAKELLLGNEHSNTIRSYFEHIFPQLRESEDERILASIADCVGLMGEDGDVFSNHNVTKIQVLSWLKKQKWQKPLETPSPSVIYTEQGDVLAEQKPAEFTHHETNESLKDAVTHQMEDDGDVDDFVRRKGR